MPPSSFPSGNEFTRRAFLNTALAGALAAPRMAMGAESPVPGAFTEPARELAVHNDADVIVCGAGPAGIAAAITAGTSRRRELAAASRTRDFHPRSVPRRASAIEAIASKDENVSQ